METNDHLTEFIERHQEMIEAARRQAAAVRAGERKGEQIGPYKLLDDLGEGGFGTVYLAERSQPHHQLVAIKIISEIHRDAQDTLARFEAERQALGLMNHDNVAKIFDAGVTAHGEPFFAMEYVPGDPITKHCDQQLLDLSKRLSMFLQVCEGVQHAHQKGIIHRDIKPSNVLASGAGGHHVVKVIDFGLAKALGMPLTEKTLHTQRGLFLGTPEYTPPEQAKADNKDLDTRADVYSLGMLLYELLSGVLPFDLHGKDFHEKLRIVREVEPVKPSARLSSLVSAAHAPRAGRKKIPQTDNAAHSPDASTRTLLADASKANGNGHGSAVQIAEHRRSDPKSLIRELRRDLDWVIMKAIEKDRNRRYASVSELAEDVRRYLRGEPPSAGPPEISYRVKKFIRRHRMGVAAAAMVAFALLAGTAVAFRGWSEAAIARDAESLAKNDAYKDKLAAEQSRDEAIAVTDFLRDMLRSIRPDRSKGREVTVREVLDEAALTIDKKLRGNPLVQAAINATIGSTYAALELDEAASPHLQKALEFRKRFLDADRIEIAESQIALGDFYLKRGEYTLAQPLYQDARVIAAKAGDEERVANCMLDLGLIASNGGDYDRAEVYIRDLFLLLEKPKNHGKDNAFWPEAQTVLAYIYRNQGKVAEAEALAREAIEFHRRLGNDRDHPSWLADSLGCLGFILSDRGQYQEAAVRLRESIDILRRLSGEGSAQRKIARVLCGLGEAVIATQDLGAGQALIQEGLEMRDRIEPLDQVCCLNAMAKFLLAGGNPKAAEDKLRESLAVLRNLRPDDNWLVARTQGSLGESLIAQGRVAEGEPFLARAYTTLKKTRGERDRFTLEVLNRILGLYWTTRVVR